MPSMSDPPVPIEVSYKPSVQIAKLPASASIEQAIEILDRDGGLILTDFATPEQLDQIECDTAPHREADKPSRTTIVWGMVGKSATMAALCEHPLLAKICKHILTDSGEKSMEDASLTYNFEPLLSISASLRIGPGMVRQRLHRDDVLHLVDHSKPYSLNNSSQLGCLIAACETKQENGATMFVPGSHRWGANRKPKLEEISFAEMKPGSAFIFLGGAYHGGGHNRTSDFTRVVNSLFFIRGTLRTEENQFLAIPRSTVVAMSPAMRTLLGYKTPKENGITLGQVEGKDPTEDLEGVFAAARA